MSAVAEQVTELADRREIAARVSVDRSCRVPVMFFFASGLLWLLAGSVLGFIASYKLHNPEFWSDFAFLTWGRVRVAHMNATVYGWACQAGMGVAIWLMARLCRKPLRWGAIVIAAGALWNIGVSVGVVGILAGDSTSIEWLEFPAYTTPILFAALVLVSAWVVMMFRLREPGHVYVSQWYLLAAFFWFPWLYGTANVLLQCVGLGGVAVGAVNWWYAQNAIWLWFTPIGLASAYYLIPKVIGRPVHSYHLAALGFWTLALFCSWNAMQPLLGGPYPAWLLTVSAVAAILMVIPVLTVAINHHMTMRDSFHMLSVSPTLRFTVFGTMAYTGASLLGSVMALRSWNSMTQFTMATTGHAHLVLYGFFSMVMFGAMYYIVPRLVGCEWRSAGLIKIHFWAAAYGILFMFAALFVGGLNQGAALLKTEYAFMDVIDLTRTYLVVRSWTGMLLTVAHLAFALNFVLMVFRLGRKDGTPTYFGEGHGPEEEVPTA